MGSVSQQDRITALLSRQNPDGGWAYVPGKSSWLEPTAYAALALHGHPASRRAFDLVRSWQRDDGAWRPNGTIDDAHWTTSLGVTLHCVNGVYDDQFRRGVRWLLNISGRENGIPMRLAHWMDKFPEGDFSLEGWPWRPGTTAWVEPTAHALVALRKAAAHVSTDKLRNRIDQGERLLIDRRCTDGGWNYGNVRVLGQVLPSYPETTALGLLGLMGGAADTAQSLTRASNDWADHPSPLARAWLSIVFRGYGKSVPPLEDPITSDNLLLALQTLGAPEGNFGLFKATV